jgi:hypothetical protein
VGVTLCRSADHLVNYVLVSSHHSDPLTPRRRPLRVVRIFASLIIGGGALTDIALSLTVTSGGSPIWMEAATWLLRTTYLLTGVLILIAVTVFIRRYTSSQGKHAAPGGEP